MRSCGFKSHLPHLNFGNGSRKASIFSKVKRKISAVVAELAYAHDSGSCPYYLGVGSSPINCIHSNERETVLDV